MKEKIPVNAEILKWARESIGLSLSFVAKKMKKTLKEIKSWESGATSPTYVQLETLASEIYKRPIALFFFPEIPNEAMPKTEFRTYPEEILGELPYEIIKAYRTAKIFQLNLEELFEGSSPSKNSILQTYKIDMNTDLNKICKDLRKYLNISIEQQLQWKSIEEAFNQWRILLEDHGIFVFKSAFKNDFYSGFCLHSEKYPVIYVNNSMPYSRQIFTLFHELGHLLLNMGGIDLRSKDYLKKVSFQGKKIEVFCNAFANRFLIPQEYFDKETLSTNEDHIENLAHKYKVSREVILRNFLDRAVINVNQYEEIVQSWNKAKRPKKGSGGDYYNTHKSYLGESYIKIVLSKYYQNKISSLSAAEYLDIKEKNLSTFEHYAIRE